MESAELIGVPVEKYETLLDISSRVKVLRNIISKSKYGVDSEMIAGIFDFDLPAKEGGE